MTRSTWRLLLSLVSLLAIFSIAVACGGDDDDGRNGIPDIGDVQQGGQVTIGAIEFETWDPHFSDFAQDIAHFFKVWRGMYELDLNDRPVPSMADGDPRVSADGKTYTIKIKSGLKWSDGDDLKAEDFVAGIQRTCNPDIAGHYQYILTAIVGCDDYYAAAEASADEKTRLLAAVGVRAVDDLTVEIKLTDPQPTFPILLALWPTFPVPVHLVTSVDAPWPEPTKNAYNGPFMVAAYTQGSNMELVPNPNWAGAQKPYLDKIILQYVDDEAVLANAYRSGEVHATRANKAELDALKQQFGEGRELILYPATRTLGLEFMLEDPTLAKPGVRLALSQATDRETMMRVVYSSGNTATTSWVPPVRNGLQGGEYDKILGFNVESAKKHLAEAGYADGQGFPRLTLLLRDSAENKLAGEFLQAEWKKHLNIDINLEFVDGPTRSGRFNRSEFQIIIGGWQEDYPDPENWFLGLWETGGSINKVKVSIKELDDLIDKARYNTNDEERRQLYRDAEMVLLKEANGIAPIFHSLAAFLVKSNIRGMLEWKRPGDTFVPGDWNPEYWALAK